MTALAHSAFEEETFSMIEALQQQEKRYACHDYCRTHAAKITCQTLEADRKLMLKWSYNVVDYFNLSRETAAMSIAYSDRFLQTDKGSEYLNDTDKYQLLCIVSLYVAVKVHETSSLPPKMFVEIGHGHYTADQMEQMETVLLNTLDWRVNPPTSLCFVRLFLDLVLPELDRGMKATAYMLARTQTERAVGDYKMVTVPPSKIAYASLVNSLHALGYGDRLASTTHLFPTDFMLEELTELRSRLSSAIRWETALMSLGPTSSHPFSKQTATKTKANVDSLEESTTPRSVLCHTISG